MIDLMPEIDNIIKLKNLQPPQIHENTVIEDKKFREFVIKINLSLQYLKSFNKTIDEIRIKRKQLVSTNSNKELKSIKDEIDLKINNCTEIQSSVKVFIFENEKFVKQSKNEDEYFSRIVNNMYSAALIRFEKVSEKFSIEKNNIKEYLKTSIIREAEIATERKLTELEKENIVNNPKLIQDLLRKKLEGQAHIDLVNKVNYLESRHEDILKLEQGISDMYQLFVDLQALVRSQGEIIENIESNISTAKEYTFHAEVDIVKANDYLKSSRKKKFIILGIVVLAMIIIIGVVVGFII